MRCQELFEVISPWAARPSWTSTSRKPACRSPPLPNSSTSPANQQTSKRFSTSSVIEPSLLPRPTPHPSGSTTMRRLMHWPSMSAGWSRWSTVRIQWTWQSAKHWLMTNLIRLMDSCRQQPSRTGYKWALVLIRHLLPLKSPLKAYALKPMFPTQVSDPISALMSTDFRFLENLASRLPVMLRHEAKEEELYTDFDDFQTWLTTTLVH